MELDPDNTDACTTASLVSLLQNRYDEAVAFGRRAVQLAPGSADAATFACFVLASSGFAEEAVALNERAITPSPSYPGYYLGHLGNAYRLSGRTQEATAAFQAYDARNPGFGLADLVINLSAERAVGAGEENGRTSVGRTRELHCRSVGEDAISP